MRAKINGQKEFSIFINERYFLEDLFSYGEVPFGVDFDHSISFVLCDDEKLKIHLPILAICHSPKRKAASRQFLYHTLF